MYLGGPSKINLLKSAALAPLFRSVSPRDRPKGQIVIYQGDPLDSFYFITSGYVRVYTISDEGEERTLLLLTDGDVFPLLKDPERPESSSLYFYAVMEDIKVIAIRQSDFLEYIRTHRQAAWTVFRYISEFTHTLAGRIEVLETKSAEHKILKLLDYLIETCGQRLTPDTYRLKLKLTQQDMADLIGHTRETTSTTMARLTRQRVLSYKAGYIVVNRQAIKEAGS